MKHENLPRYIGPDTTNRNGKMTRAEVKKRFDSEAAHMYSQREPAWMPDFKYMFNLVPEILKPYVRSGDLILDIGAGTGNLSRTILENVDSIKITLMDFSRNMLNEVPEVLAGYKGKYKTITADFMTGNFGKTKFRAVVSSFAIHHCRNISEYRYLYDKIFDSIKKSGVFICCDVVSGGNSQLSKLNEQGWDNFLDDQNFPRDEREKILSNYHAEDSPISLWEHMHLLKETGFTSVDVVWKKFNFALYTGIIQNDTMIQDKK